MGLIADRLAIRTGAPGKVDKVNLTLAPGRYWLDVFDEEKPMTAGMVIPTSGNPAFDAVLIEATVNNKYNPVAMWNAWIAAHVGHVKVLQKEYYEPTDKPGIGTGDYPARYWILFEVEPPEPANWEIAVTNGWPTPAADNIKTSDDTVQKPPPEKTGLDALGGDSNLAWVPWAIGGAIGVVGLVALAKLVRG